MTIITYRDGVMAADAGVRTSRGVLTGRTVKAWRRKADGALCGAAGSLAEAQAFRDWFLAGEYGERPGFSKDDGGSEALIVSPDGSVRYFDDSGATADEVAGFFAIGCGAELALGAMAAGVDAERAAEIAVELHADCTGPLTVLRLGRPQDWQKE